MKNKKDRKIEVLMEKIAPTQMDYQSPAAKKGARVSPTWKPDDIGTENFRESMSTAYLRDME